MAGILRERQDSETSTDSSMLEMGNQYESIDLEHQNLIKFKPRADEIKGDDSVGRLKCLAVASLVVSLICLFTLGGFCCCYYFGVFPVNSKALSEKEKVCMPCNNVNPSPLEESESPLLQELDVHVDEDGETDICCASTPAQYATLFKLIMERQEGVKKLADILGPGSDSDVEDDKIPDGSLGATGVSAHLLFKPTKTLFKDEAGQTLQKWKSPQESPVSHVRGGVKFHNHKIFVQTRGLYYVYCQILYNGPHSVDGAVEEPMSRVVSHYVKRHSLLYPFSTGFLLKARHTRVSGHDDRHSSYVGGLFYLEAGDQVFVQVSAPELVSHDDRASFFGLFKVGN